MVGGLFWRPLRAKRRGLGPAERVLCLRLLFFYFRYSTAKRVSGAPPDANSPLPRPRQPVEVVSGSQPPAWIPSQASWQEGCRGSRSEERILNHIYMCMMQKGKRKGGGKGSPPESKKKVSKYSTIKKKRVSHQLDLSQMFSNRCP